MVDRAAESAQDDRLRSHAPAVWAPKTYVVMEVKVPQDPRRNAAAYMAWAWCQCSNDGPGFAEISYTLDDGRSMVDSPTVGTHLGRVLFTVTVA
jgi:hypothetical protein